MHSGMVSDSCHLSMCWLHVFMGWTPSRTDSCRFPMCRLHVFVGWTPSLTGSCSFLHVDCTSSWTGASYSQPHGILPFSMCRLHVFMDWSIVLPATRIWVFLIPKPGGNNSDKLEIIEVGPCWTM